MVTIFDTTLRDGEQTPGAHLSRGHKLEIARQLERLGVNVIEAGFPASSKGDFRAVSEIAAAIKNCTVCGLSRCHIPDIDAAYEAVRAAAYPRIHVFIATSDIHLEAKLRMTREQALERVEQTVSYARKLCEDIEFSAEDATRSDVGYLYRVIETAIRAGATTINIPDTVGYALPAEFGALIRGVIENVPGADRVKISAHCHNDLGNAVANSIAALEAGASQVECTVNGIGERAGNAALEEIVMTLNTRSDILPLKSTINIAQIARTSRMVSSLSGLPISPNKAIVGANAFAHESGIHQHGILRNRLTYEIMTPESIGLSSDTLTLGKLSGSHAFAQRVGELGYTLDERGLSECFERFKLLADRKVMTDEDIMALVNEYLDTREGVWKLESFQTQSGNLTRAMAMVTLSREGSSTSEAAVGDGPVDAAFNAVRRLSGIDEIILESYSIKAVTEGEDALGEAKVKIRIDEASFTGRSVSTDIIEASIKAYVSALNKYYFV